MDMPKLLTSGQASGLTQVSYMRLYHYVRDFPEYFSEGAKKHTRGRRWTPADIEIVLTIKALYINRLGKEVITQKLAEGWRLPSEGYLTREAIDSLYEATMTLYDMAENIMTAAKKLNYEVAISTKPIKEDHDRITQLNYRVEQVETQIYEIFKKTRRRGLFR
jgi:hypothetical protein